MDPSTADVDVAADLATAVLAATTDLVVAIDTDGIVRYANDAVRVVLGHDGSDLVGTSAYEAIHPDDREFVAGRLADARSEPRPRVEPVLTRLRDADGEWIPVEAAGARPIRHDDVDGVVVVLRDVRPRRAAERRLRLATQRLAHAASHDSLTRLPNRQALERVLAAVDPGDGNDPPPFLMIVRVCGLDEIRRRRGLGEVERVVRAVAASVRACVRAEDFVASETPSEFAVIPAAGSTDTDVDALGRRLLAIVNDPLPELLGPTDVTLGVGVSTIDRGAARRSIDEAGDAARWSCDHGGRNVATFDETMREQLAARRRTEHEVARAVTNDELELHYQPIVTLDTGAIEGFEALLRWRHPERGLLTAGAFLHAVEGTAAMVDIGRRVVGQAAAQLAAFRSAGAPDVYVAINVSLRQLRAPGFADELAAALDAHGVAPDRLTVELTETYAADRHGAAADEIADIGRLGVRLALDDFGTGFSSLQHLQAVRAHTLKIDRAFVAQLGVDDGAAAIARATIDLARAFDMHCVAEGVETTGQRDHLRRLGCPSAQGYLFREPVSGPEALPLAAAGTLDVGRP